MRDRHAGPFYPDAYPRGRLRRYRQVVQILARHGFGWLLGQLGLRYPRPFRWVAAGRGRRIRPTAPQQLRLALEELGVTFIKLGQILSTRSDILPDAYIVELSRLQDAVPQEPLEVVVGQITAELGTHPDELFAEFEPVPLGSASIGQVHAARLRTGEEVVVKVQRPGVDRLVEEDLAILMDLARLAASRTVWGQIYDLPGLVEEFANTLRSEMDYVQEAKNAERFAASFAEEPRLQVPRVYQRFTTRRVLTLERLHGVKIDDLAALETAGVDRKALAETGAQVVLKMVLHDGFFHADPHPGNFLVLPDGRLGLLDYGMVGLVDESTREGLLYLLLAISNQDMDRVIDQLTALGVTGSIGQVRRLRRDLAHLLSLYWGLPLRDIDVTKVLEESMEMARRHQMRVPTSLVLLAKTLAMNEGIGRRLDPDFSTVDVLRPYVLRLAWESYMPWNWRKRLLPTFADLTRLAVTLPRRSERLLTQLERGEFSINMHVQDTERVISELDAMVNRLILGMLVSGFAIGTGLLTQAHFSTELSWLINWLVIVGMAIVVGLGAWLAITILRHMRW
ncbi:MAG TPA: AarF/ABC1/UbiB kinase family protein [Chloroflexota bacterium]